MINLGHVEGKLANYKALDGEGLDDDDEIVKAQDFHSMLEVMLKNYVDLQEMGFLWDFEYNNQNFKDLKFILFMPFVQADGEEVDKLCGKYLSRMKGVAQLCQYCEVLTNKTDDPKPAMH